MLILYDNYDVLVKIFIETGLSFFFAFFLKVNNQTKKSSIVTKYSDFDFSKRAKGDKANIKKINSCQFPLSYFRLRDNIYTKYDDD